MKNKPPRRHRRPTHVMLIITALLTLWAVPCDGESEWACRERGGSLFRKLSCSRTLPPSLPPSLPPRSDSGSDLSPNYESGAHHK